MPCGRHRLQCPGASTLYVSWIFYLRAWAPFPLNTNEGSSGVPPGVSDVSRSKPTFGFHSPQPTFPFPSRWRDSKRGTGKRKPGAFERSLPCAGKLGAAIKLAGLRGPLTALWDLTQPESAEAIQGRFTCPGGKGSRQTGLDKGHGLCK